MFIEEELSKEKNEQISIGRKEDDCWGREYVSAYICFHELRH